MPEILSRRGEWSATGNRVGALLRRMVIVPKQGLILGGLLLTVVLGMLAIANASRQNAVKAGHAPTQTMAVVALPSVTAAPSNTPIPPKATRAPTNTPRPSATSTATSTPVPTSAILYAEDFNDGNAYDWKYYGDWKILKDETGNYVYEGTGSTNYPQAWLETIGYEWTDYAFESRVRILKGGIFVLVRASEIANFYNAFLPSGGTVSLAKFIKSQYSVYQETDYSINSNQWYLVCIAVEGGEYRLYINDKLVTAYSHSGASLLTHGSIGYYIGGGDKVQIDDVRVWALSSNSSDAVPTATPTPPTKTHVPADTATSVPASNVVSIAVSGTQGWQSTGVTVNQGQRIQIVYGSGTWAGRAGLGQEFPDIWADASGIDFEIYYAEFGIMSRFASLIGKIGDGPVIQVGRSYETVSEQTGTLFLRMFDIDMNDNAGSINVQITVWP